MTPKIKSLLLLISELLLIFAVLVGLSIADKYISSDNIPDLNIKFFRSGEDFYILFRCGDSVAVMCPQDETKKEEFVSLLKDYRIDNIDYIIFDRDLSEKEAKEYFGDRSFDSEFFYGKKSEQPPEITLGAAKGKITFFDGSSYSFCLEHGEQRLVFCSGNLTAAEYKKQIKDADFIEISSSQLGDPLVNGIFEESTVNRTVLCDKFSEPAGEELLKLLRKKDIDFAFTRYGDICVKSNGKEIFLLPDTSMIV